MTNINNIKLPYGLTCEDLYLHYFNDFLTVDYFAEYYGLSKKVALEVIKKGREINHNKS